MLINQKKLIPAVLFKEIDKSLSKEEFAKQLSEDENIKLEDINIKVELNNSRFKTKRFIVYLPETTTKYLLSRGCAKVGFLLVPVEATYKIIQCIHCQQFGHYYKNKLGEINCPNINNPKCRTCSENHLTDQCTINKEDKLKHKCINCKQNHTANFSKCSKRIEIYEKIKNKFIC